MAGISQDISIQVNNSLNRKANVTLLGGTQDPSNGQANAKTLYEWDLSAESFSNTTVVEIQASTVTNPEVISYIAVNQDGEIRSLQTVVSLLNTLNLGTFNIDGNTIFILDDINVFGELSVKINQTFNIDTFVESGYNYFDPESKTTLVDFSTKYKPLIEQAVNTIPTFVEFIETQGWSLAFVFESSTLRFNRSVSGDVYHISDNLGTLTTTKYSGTNNINTNTFQKSLLFVFDLNIFTTCTLFEANALTSVQSVIYKYVFNSTFVSWNQDSLVLAGWKPLSPNYFPTINGTHSIKINASDTNILADYGNSFPSVNQINTSSTLTFVGVNSGTEKTFFVGTAIADAELNFGNSASLSTTRISKIESLNGRINVNFATLNYITALNKLDNVKFKIFFGDSSPQVVTLDSAFNEKFRKTSETDFNALQLFLQGTLGGSNFPQLIYADDTTPLQINVDEINFRNTYTQNLPPIQVLGGYDGSATVFSLDLDIQYQANQSNISMRYFNDWFYKVGTQDAIYDENIVSGTRLIEAENNTFLLSGRGLQGYYSLAENNYTVNIPTGTLLSGGILSFTTRPNPPTNITLQTVTAGLGQSDFEITYSEDGQTDTVQASSFFAINREQLQIANSSNELNVLMTQRPSLDTTNFNIGSTGFTDQFSTFYFTSTPLTTELFNFPTQQINISVSGFTLDMPIYDLAENEVDAKGLFQRDFSQAYGGTNAEFTIGYFKINGTKFANSSFVAFPNGRAIFNFPNGTDRIDRIIIGESEFGTVYTNNLFGKQNSIFSNNFLEMLFGNDAIAQNGIEIINTNFNGVDDSLAYLEVPIHLASLYNGTSSVQGLSGTSVINNVRFSQTQPDRLLFESDWDGSGFGLNTLIISGNPNLEQINLSNSNTATPNALQLNVRFNSKLEVLNFTNHNITQLTFEGNTLINNVNLSKNDLPSSEIDSLINDIDSYGTSNGTLNYINQTSGSIPSLASQTSYNNLNSRGWYIIGNKPTATASGIDISNYLFNSSYQKTLPTSPLLAGENYQFSTNGNNFVQYNSSNIQKSTVTQAFIPSTIGNPNQIVSKSSVGLSNSGRFRIVDNDNYLFAINDTTGTLQRFDFGSNLDLSTLSLSQTSISFGLNDYSFTFSNDGTNLFIFESTSNTSDTIKKYTLSNPFDLTTLNITPTNSPSLSAMGVPLVFGQYFNLEIDTLGETILIASIEGTVVPNIDDIYLYQIDLSTPLDITSASYSGNSKNISGDGVEISSAPNLAFIYALRDDDNLEILI